MGDKSSAGVTFPVHFPRSAPDTNPGKPLVKVCQKHTHWAYAEKHMNSQGKKCDIPATLGIDVSAEGCRPLD
jgi:hypothetical protein